VGGRLLVLAAATLWGTTGTTQALGPSAAAPASVGAVRIAVGCIGLLALATAGRQLGDVRAWFTTGRRAAAAWAILSIAAYQVTFFAGVARAGVAIGTIVGIGSAPLFTGLLELVVRRRRPERRWGIATALGIAGCVLLVGAGGDAQVDPLGVLLALGAGASYAVYTVSTKQLLDTGLGAIGTMAVTFTGGALLLAPILAGADLAWLAEPRGLLAAAWLGLVTVGIAYALFGRGLALLPAATVATLTLAEPLTAGMLGVAVLGERPGLVAGAGALAVAAGLVLLAVRPPIQEA
jgi:drug/metabolite transporter, DME family